MGYLLIFGYFLAIIVLPIFTSYQLFGTPYPAIVGETFELTCITTSEYVLFSMGSYTLAIIIGGYPNGTCKISGSYNTNYSFTCFPNNYTYKVTMTGAFNSYEVINSTWRCQSVFGGNYVQLNHFATSPNVTVLMKPGATVMVMEKTSVSFHCYVPIRESWQVTEFFDSVLGNIVKFGRNGSKCEPLSSVLSSYNVTCSLKTGRFSVQLLATPSWYDGQKVTCKAQFGIGIKSRDKTFEAFSTIILSDRNKLVISPLVVAFGESVPVTLSCHLNTHQTEVVWYKNFSIFQTTGSNDQGTNCTRSILHSSEFEYNCDVDGRLFELVILPKYVTYGTKDVSWTCASSNNITSNQASFRVTISTISSHVYQLYTDVPAISNANEVLCMSPNAINITCKLNMSLNDYVKDVTWQHRVHGVLIRHLNGTFDGMTSRLCIPFCTVHDTGTYTCVMKTDLPNFDRLNGETTLSVSGAPLFTDKKVMIVNSSSGIEISAFFYSFTAPALPVWTFNNRTLSPGTKYSESTSKETIKMLFYDRMVNVNGFKTTLRIFHYESQDDGEYTVTISNSVSSAMETISVQFLSTSEFQNDDTGGYSTSVLAAVAVGCTISTSLIAIIVSCFIFKRQRIGGTVNTNKTEITQNYDELGMKSLSNVYDTVQHEST